MHFLLHQETIFEDKLTQLFEILLSSTNTDKSLYRNTNTGRGFKQQQNTDLYKLHIAKTPNAFGVMKAHKRKTCLNPFIYLFLVANSCMNPNYTITEHFDNSCHNVYACLCYSSPPLPLPLPLPCQFQSDQTSVSKYTPQIS